MSTSCTILVASRKYLVTSNSRWSWAGSSPNPGSPNGGSVVDTAQLDLRAYCTPQSSTLIMSYITSFLASFFCNISFEASFTAVMMKSKSSTVSIVFILVMVALGFFQEEGFEGETFLFFKRSTSSLANVTLPCFCSYPFPFISSTL
jgi:hypothetical protein